MAMLNKQMVPIWNGDSHDKLPIHNDAFPVRSSRNK